MKTEEIEKMAMDSLKNKWSHLYFNNEYPKKPYPTGFENDLKNIMLGILLNINSNNIPVAFLEWSTLNSEYCGKTFDGDSLIFRCKVENPTPDNTYTLFTPEQLFQKFIKTIEL